MTLATCKHFDGYSVDEMPPRLSFDPKVSQTDLVRHCLCLVFPLPSWLRQCLCLADFQDQYFLPAWETCAKFAASVMCAYNGL